VFGFFVQLEEGRRGLEFLCSTWLAILPLGFTLNGSLKRKLGSLRRLVERNWFSPELGFDSMFGREELVQSLMVSWLAVIVA